MKRHEFEEALVRCDMNKTTFALMVRRSKDAVFKWGANGEDVPHWVALIMRLIQERRNYRDLFRDNK